jgi:hypothetical protein
MLTLNTMLSLPVTAASETNKPLPDAGAMTVERRDKKINK